MLFAMVDRMYRYNGVNVRHSIEANSLWETKGIAIDRQKAKVILNISEWCAETMSNNDQAI